MENEKKKITENSPKNEGKHFKHDRKNFIITIISISVIVLIINMAIPINEALTYSIRIQR